MIVETDRKQVSLFAQQQSAATTAITVRKRTIQWQ